MNLISITQRKNVSYRSNEKQKSGVGAYYNITKGDANATGERLMTYAIELKSKRYHVIVFCNLLDLFALFFVYTFF